MLSRVAERLFWLGRYIERAENTARVLQSYSQFLLDVPLSAQISWRDLLRIAGTERQYQEYYEAVDERSVVKFLLTDSRNAGSVFESISAARENLRTTREVLPNDAWEAVNDFHLFLKDEGNGAIGRRRRAFFLKQIGARCLHFAGLIEGGLSHDTPYRFVQIGRFLERADMTTRILDLGSAGVEADFSTTEGEAAEDRSLNALLWMNILQTLSAYEMYRWHVMPDVKPREVIRFVLFDEHFPRSVRHCLDRINRHLRRLPRWEEPAKALDGCLARLESSDVSKVMKQGLYIYNDTLQGDFAGLSNAIAARWFTQAWELPAKDEAA